MHRAQQPELAVDGLALNEGLNGNHHTGQGAQQGQAAVEAVGEGGLLEQAARRGAQQRT
ncbi:hypothetical protein D3C79_874320 [compost metagenome]